MSRSSFWRKALAVPAAIALALGGVALTAAPASAAPAGLTVTSPANGSTVESSTVTVTGEVFGGSSIRVYAADGTTVIASTNPGGQLGQPTPYSVTLPAYAADAPAAQTIFVGGIYGGSGIPQERVDFNLPAVAPVGNFTVTSPKNGDTVGSREVTFTGTGTFRSLVNVLDTNGNRVAPQAYVGSDGQWSTTGTYADDAAISQTVNFNQLTGFSGNGTATVTFNLPAVAPVGNFTVTSPKNGDTVDSRTVTFTGTGTEGSNVNVLNTDGTRAAPQARVNSDGQWSTTATYTDDAPVAQTVNINQVTGGAGRGNATVNFNLPAVAPVGNFTVTSPKNGDTVDSHTVTFTGTGTEGSNVNVLNTDGTRAAPQARVNSDGQWSTTATYTDDAPVAQTVNINQVTGGAGRGNATVNFNLPAVAPVGNFTVTSPKNGDTVDSRTVTFTGTGTSGSTVNILDADGNRIPGTTAAVVIDGQWSTTGTYAADAPVAQTVYANQVTGGAGRGNQTVSFLLPADEPVQLPAPVITSPTEGETVSGMQVTFEGTGTPGAYVGLAIAPTELVENGTVGVDQITSAGPVLVDENGNWTVTASLLPENYTAVAIQAVDSEGLTGISAPSELVNFSLVAFVPADNGSGSTPITLPTTPSSLAATGGADLSMFFGLAALSVLAGAGAFVVGKRRRVLS